MECKSPQGDSGDCMEEEKEGECTSKLFGGDMKTTYKDVGSCIGGDRPFVSYPKGYYKYK